MKNIPTIRPERLVTTAILKRDPPYDVLITGAGDGDARAPMTCLPALSSMGRSWRSITVLRWGQVIALFLIGVLRGKLSQR